MNLTPDDLINELDGLAIELRRVGCVMVENPDHPAYVDLEARAMELYGVSHRVESWMDALIRITPPEPPDSDEAEMVALDAHPGWEAA